MGINLERLVQIRDSVAAVCAAIDAGEYAPDDATLYAMATLVQRECGPIAHDLLCQLASRCESGRKALKASAS